MFTIMLYLLSQTFVTAFPKLDNFWNGQAVWQFHNWLNQSNMPGYDGWNSGEGLSLVTVADGTWYLFSRQVYWNQTAYCSLNGDALIGTVVRKSQDLGMSWSAPNSFLVPQEGSPYECMGGDGGAYFDAVKGVWHYLYQCLDRRGVWSGCHMFLQANDPVTAPAASWQQSPANPVIAGGSLWSRICSLDSAACHRLPAAFPNWLHPPTDEGTFDIFAMDEQRYFYISFHGYDGINGYRGIAKTIDFVTYIVGDASQGVAADAIFNPYQPANWRESWQGWNRGGGVESGTVGWSSGGGAGAVYFEDPFYYLVVETSDLNLGCLSGQNWDVGLLRSRSLADAPWESFPGNPIFYNDRVDDSSAACNLAYNKIFQDPRTSQLFIHQHRSTGASSLADGIFFYKLTASSGVLQNGNLWKCNTDDWDTLPQPKGHPPTNLVVYRSIALSPDHNCVMAFNCGDGTTACDQGQSVFQDVAIQNFFSVGQNITFSGVVGTQASIPAVVRVVIFFLSSTYEILNTTVVDVKANTIPQFTQFGLTAKFVGGWAVNATTLRAQLYPLNAGITYFAGELALN